MSVPLDHRLLMGDPSLVDADLAIYLRREKKLV
jgi:hypothetical protein